METIGLWVYSTHWPCRGLMIFWFIFNKCQNSWRIDVQFFEISRCKRTFFLTISDIPQNYLFYLEHTLINGLWNFDWVFLVHIVNTKETVYVRYFLSSVHIYMFISLIHFTLWSLTMYILQHNVNGYKHYKCYFLSYITVYDTLIIDM